MSEKTTYRNNEHHTICKDVCYIYNLFKTFLGGVFFFAWVVQAPIRHYTIGKEIVDLVLDRIRKLADNCTGREIASSVRFVLYFGIIITYIFGCCCFAFR